jgi:hypothetical protein
MGWIGVDLDGTLAEYTGWKGPGQIGKPVPAMVERVKRWLADGRDVRIMTARVSGVVVSTVNSEREAIRAWCQQHLGRELPVTNVKDHAMEELWDDRAVEVRRNTGEPVNLRRRGD